MSKYFSIACTKKLAAVEVSPSSSRQHEFNGVAVLRDMFGSVGFTQEAEFSIMGRGTTAFANVTWYDAREKHESRSEFRLYFQGNAVMSEASEGDNIIIGFDKFNKLNIVLIPQSATSYAPVTTAWQQYQGS